MKLYQLLTYLDFSRLLFQTTLSSKQVKHKNKISYLIFLVFKNVELFWRGKKINTSVINCR